MNFTINTEMKENEKMPITPKGVKILIVGTLVIAAGNILMMGGGSDDPNVFNNAMFDFRRLYAAPFIVICGVVIEVIGIMRIFKDKKKGK